MSRFQQGLREKSVQANLREAPEHLRKHGKEYRRRKAHSRKPVSYRTRVVVIICAALPILVAADYWLHYGRIYPGVEVGGVALGGKTPEEARTTLEGRTTELERIRFIGGTEEPVSLSTDKLGVDLDVGASVDRLTPSGVGVASWGAYTSG